MIQYFPIVTGSLVVLGNVSVSGSINASGSVTISGSIASASYALSASNAATASSADNFLTRGTLTAQTLVVQTITSSVDFVTGSTRFGSISSNTHQFTGSMSVTGSATFINGITSNDKIYAVGSVADNILEAVNTDSTNGYGLFVRGGGNAVNRYVARFKSGADSDVFRIEPSGQLTAYGKYYVAASVADNIVELINSDATNGYGLYIKAGGTASNRYVARFLNAANTDIMFISASGRVGIGTTNPLSILHIQSAAGSTKLTMQAPSGQPNIIEFLTNAGVVDARVKNETSQLQFEAGSSGTPIMVVSASGNVGISTTNPVAKLHLRGSGTSGQVTATQIWENLSSGTFGLEISGSAGSSYAVFKYGGGPGTGTATLTQAMAIVLEGASAGKVGIGTTSPGQNLTVYSDINSDARISLTNPNTGASARTFLYAITSGNRYVGMLAFGSGSTGTTAGLSNASLGVLEAGGDTSALLINSGGTSSPMVFAINATERMRITSGFSVSCPNGSATTLFDIASVLSTGSTGLVTVYNSTNGYGMATLVIMRDGVGGVSQAQIGTQPTATYLSFSLSGTNLQVTPAIGAGTYTIKGSVIRISS